MSDDEEEGTFGGLYEDGHWVWDEMAGSLGFISDLPPKAIEAVMMPTKLQTGTIEFRDDVDLIEQIRYRRRYQRKLKPGQADVVTLQDVKDIALYTAPITILSPMLINMLHLPTTERFIRALILCTQYYIQVADEMTRRIQELDTKVRTSDCDIVEKEFSDNLSDLRVLVAKEYCTMLIGGADTKKFHHMGPQKKRQSLSDKDARLFETLLRMCVQIVWLSLGRKAFNQIEVEINRLFKSEIFNAVEHTLKTGYIAKMSKEEHGVLLGPCVRRDKKLNTRSPFMNEVFCARPIDYMMMGLGVVKCNKISSRLRYMYFAVARPEEELQPNGVSVGILGHPRAHFDTMLTVLPTVTETKSKTIKGSNSATSAKSNTASLKKCSSTQAPQLYADIILPPKEEDVGAYLPASFPEETEEARLCSEIQRKRWQTRLTRLLHSHVGGFK